MAMFIRGLNDVEGETLTREMLYSGDVLDFSGVAMPKADKHSTGGVGDKTSLLIAPIVAACDVAVPMVSGRGLGHTGGTLDKLESIPGYNVNLSTDQFRSIVERCGFAMTGQTERIAPADKKIYALRDATATVPYIPLIVASIMSKKLAEGLDALVLDVKTGSGAFMQKLDDARELASALVETGEKFGVKSQAVISDMSQPLGQFVGNALEIYECVQILRGEADECAKATTDLSLELAARMVHLGGAVDSLETARKCVANALSSGDAIERFRRNVKCQGGDPKICDDPSVLLEKGITRIDIKAANDGFVSTIDTLAIGNALVELGGGRRLAGDAIDHAIGYQCSALLGSEVRAGDPLGVLFCRDERAAVQKITEAYSIADAAPDVPELVRDVIPAS
jgi:pyrimidine-nucleoside phosphorylase